MHIRHGADDGEEGDDEKLDPIREGAKVPWVAWWSVTPLDDVIPLESRSLGKGELTRCRDSGPKRVIIIGGEYSDQVNHTRNAIVAKSGASGTVEDQIEVRAHGECEPE